MKVAHKALAAITLALAGLTAHAAPGLNFTLDSFAPEAVGLHLASVHSNNGRDYMGPDGWNDANPGVYIRLHNGLTAGVLQNSERRTSVYGGWTISTPGRMFSLTLGAITGYEGHTLYPLVVPSMNLNLAAVGLPTLSLRTALLLPPGCPAAVHFMIEHKF